MGTILKNGMIAGMLLIIFSLAIYMINPELFAKIWFGGLTMLVSLIVYLVFMTRAANERKREEFEGYLSFKQAFGTTFSTGMIAMVLGAIFTYLLYNVIDPNLAEMIRDGVMDSTYSLMETIGAPESSIEEALEQIEEQEFGMTVTQVLKNIAGGAVMGAIVCLILSAIIKKNKPVLEEETI